MAWSPLEVCEILPFICPDTPPALSRLPRPDSLNVCLASISWFAAFDQPDETSTLYWTVLRYTEELEYCRENVYRLDQA